MCRAGIALEWPAGAGDYLPYRPGDEFDDVDFPTLISLISGHLKLRT